MERDEIERERIVQAVDFALSKTDFDSAEGERYLALAFERDMGIAYGRIAKRLETTGAFGPERATSSALKAFFAQRPGVLAVLARDWPGSVAAQREDGLDMCKHGLAMAVATGRREAALWIAEALGSQPQAGERMEEAFRVAREMSEPAVQSVVGWRSDMEAAERDHMISQIIAECERVAIGEAVPRSEKTSRGAKAL